MSTLEFDILTHKPSRSTGMALRQHMIEQIIQHRAEVGTSLMSAEELADHFGVSRSTMNRVLDGLQRDGWIERRVGQGTFVGQRAAYAIVAPSPPAALKRQQHMLRFAVIVAPKENDPADWHAQGLIDGIDAAAEDGVLMEFIGRGKEGFASLGKRLAQTSPDAIILMKPGVKTGAVVLQEAAKLNIPVVVTGTRLRDFDCVSVEEDGVTGMAEAVRMLAQRGHKRIGLTVSNEVAHLWRDRWYGYEKGLKLAGLPIDRNLIFWHPHPTAFHCFDQSETLYAYLQEQKPTALIMAMGPFIEACVPLVQSGRLKMPQDLSLVVFDQVAQGYAGMLNGCIPTVVELPLKEMATQAVAVAKKIAMKQEYPRLTRVACPLMEGNSVRTLDQQ